MTTALAETAVSSAKEEKSEDEKEEGELLANSIDRLNISSLSSLALDLDLDVLPSSSPPSPLTLLDLPTHVLALCVRLLPTAKDVARAACSSKALRDALEEIVLSSSSSRPSPSPPFDGSESGGEEPSYSYPSCALPGVRSLDLRCRSSEEAAEGLAYAARHFPLLRTLRVGARCPLPRGSLAAWASSEGRSSFPFPPLEEVSFHHEKERRKRSRRKRSSDNEGSGGDDDGEEDRDFDDEEEEEEDDREDEAARPSPPSSLPLPPPGEVALFLRAAAPTLRSLDLGTSPRSHSHFKLGGAVSAALRSASNLRRLRARSVGSDVLAPLAEAFFLKSSTDESLLPALRSLDLAAFSPAALSAGPSLRVLSPGITKLRLRFAAGGGESVGLAFGVFPESWQAPSRARRGERRRRGGGGEEDEAQGGGENGEDDDVAAGPFPHSQSRLPPPPWPRLVSVDVSGCSSFDDASLLNLCGGAPRLRRLRARGCHALTDKGVAAAFSFFSSFSFCSPPSLSLVDLRGCLRVGDEGAAAVARALTGRDGGVEGEGEEIRVLWGSTGAGDAALTALAAALSPPPSPSPQPASSPSSPTPRLVELDLSGCSRATAAGLRALVTSGSGAGGGGTGGALSSLRSLRASNSTLLHPYLPASSRSPNLKNSSSSSSCCCLGCGERCGGSCAGSPVQLLARSGAGLCLQHLAADGAPMPDSAAAALAAFCRRLRSLSLVACPSLSGKGIAALAKGCPRLTELSLGGGGGGGANWRESDLRESPLAPRLRSLRLARRPALRDEELRDLLRAAPQLRRFVLSAAPRVTDDGLTPDFGNEKEEGEEETGTEEAAAAATATKAKMERKKPPPPFLPNLAALSIPCCTGIQGARLSSLTALTSLELLGCSGVAPRAAAAAALGLTRLREIVLPPAAVAGDLPVGAPGSRLEALAVFH